MVRRGDIARRSRAPPRDGRPWRSAAFAFFAALLLRVPPASDAYELACQPEGSVTTVAGDGTPGFRDGLQERSAFRSPSGVAVRAATGDVYVADSGNHRIRKITPANQVSTVVGSGVAGWMDGAATRARLSDPRGLAWSTDGLLFVADAGNHRIRVVDLEVGGVATYAGSGEDGYLDHEHPLNAQIKQPTGLAYHAETRVLYVTDGDGRIRGARAVGDPDGAGVFTLANAAGRSGFVDSNDGLNAAFDTPMFIAFDDTQSTLYIADRRNHAVRAMDVATGAVTTAAGRTGAPPERGSSLAADGARGGPVLPGGEAGVRFDEPVGVAFFLEPLDVGGGGIENAGSGSPHGRRTLLVTELGSNRVRRVALDGNVTGSEGVASVASFSYAGSYVAASGHRDELGPASMFAAPAGVAVVPPAAGGAASGASAYVCDAGNHAVRRLERRLPTRLRVSVSATDVSRFDGSAEEPDINMFPLGASAYARRDEVVDTYAYYSVNGPPGNETTHLADALSYRGETHDATMCAYPGAEYFFHFKGALRAVVADESLFESRNVTKHNAYVAWEGKDGDDERSETVKLRGGGCTDPRAPNHDAWATHEDGTCVAGVSVRVTIKSLGAFGVYQIEGPGVYYTEELAPRASHEDDENEPAEDDVHELVFGAYPQAAYTLQLHGALSAVVADAPGQTTNFTYLNHTSRNVNSHRIEVFRPAGAGCTRTEFINYSPFATSDDGTCVTGAFLMVDSASSNGTGATDLLDWYEFGVVNALQPLLLGGQAVLTPVLFTAANATAQQTVYVAPGRFPVHVFGDARATVARVDEAGESSVLLSVDGRDERARVDEHGFNSTLGDALGFLTVLGVDDVTDANEGASDAMVMGTGADATITNLVVANLSASAKANARNDLVSDGARGAWDFLSRTWRANPLRRELDFVAKVTFPYDVAKLPTVKGNAEAVVVRASDETASDWRVVPGAVFDAAAEKVTVLVDVFSLFSVAARASARAVEPARVRHTGGAPLTLDGVDFRVPPVYNATGSVFCKFGELFTKAEWVSSRDPRGFGDAALCATPAVSRAGFVSVEFYDAGTYQNSASDLRVLFTAPPLVSRVSPSSGPDTGAALVALAGAAFAHLGGDGKRDVACHFGDFGDFGGVAPGVAVSSAVALCETPAADAKRHAEVRVGVASDGAHDARTAAYRYRVSLADAVFTLGGDGAEGKTEEDTNARELFGVGAGGAVVDARLGTVRGALARETKCSFGAVVVAARRVSENGEGLHCVAPAGAGRKTVALVASSAEPGARLAAFQYVEEEDSFFWAGLPPSGRPASRAGVSVTNDPERFAASLFVGEDGRYGARLEMAASGDAATFVSRAKKTKPRCALGGVAAATELASSELTKVRRAGSFSVFSGKENVSSTTSTSDVSRRVVLSCSPTRGRLASGFVAVALAPDGADAPAAAEPVASLLVPSPKEAPRFFGVLGGAHVPAAAGAHVWLAGAHLLPRGGGGSWPGTNAGFGWGNGGDLTCAVDAFDVASREKTTFNEKNAHGKKNVFGAARFVSSALVACEVPDVFVARDDTFFSEPQETQETDVRLRASVAEIGFASFENENENETERVVARATRGATVSSATGHAFLPADGGAAVRVAWRGVGSFGDTPRDPSWVACAFGAVAPVAMRAEAAGENALAGENAGVCASPARAPEKAAGRNRNKPFAVSSRGSRGFSFGVAYPNFGRARFEPEASDNAAEVVSMASARLWTPLASAVPRSGGAEVRVAGVRVAAGAAAAPRDASCAFGTARDFLATRTATDAGFVSFACASPRVARGGFVTLRVDLAGFAVTDDVREASRARHPLVTGRGFALLAYAAPRAVAVAPRSAADRGGTVAFVAGFDFPGDASLGDLGAAAGACFCAFFAESGNGETLFAVEAARVSSTLTRCEMPPLFAPLAERLSEREADGDATEAKKRRNAFSFAAASPRRAASVAIARGADFAPARALPSGVEITAHVAPRVAAARPSSVPADDGGALVAVSAAVGDEGRSFLENGSGFFSAPTTCVFGAVSVRANPAADDDDIATFECATPTRARGAAPVALVREWDVTFDASVEVTFV